MKVSSMVRVALVLVIVLGAGLYIANLVKESGGQKACILGLGPARQPTLCYGFSQSTSPGKTAGD